LVRVLGAEIPAKSLILRLIAGLIFSAIMAIILFMAPNYILSTNFSDPTKLLKTIVPQVLSPQLPGLGLLTAVSIIPVMLLRKTRAEGYLLTIFGGLLALYTLILFNFGSLNIRFTESALYLPFGVTTPFTLSVKINTNLQLLTLIYLLTPLLIVSKGILLILRNNKNSSKQTSSN